MYHQADSDTLADVVENLYKEHCSNSRGQQVRRMVGIGLSLGAGVLGLYAGKSRDLNRFDAQVGIGATFKTKVAQDFLA